MPNIAALERKTHGLVKLARELYPEKKVVSFFTRELFSAEEWARLDALQTELNFSRPIREIMKDSSDEQLDRIKLWMHLQDERRLHHDDHCSILLEWLVTPWSYYAARLVALNKHYNGELPNLPYKYAFVTDLRNIERGPVESIHRLERIGVRKYVHHIDQGVNYEPCYYHEP